MSVSLTKEIIMRDASLEMSTNPATPEEPDPFAPPPPLKPQ